MANFVRFIRALRIAMFGIPQSPCRHHWKAIEKTSVWSDIPTKYPIRYDHTLQCTNCGDMKTFKG